MSIVPPSQSERLMAALLSAALEYVEHRRCIDVMGARQEALDLAHSIRNALQAHQSAVLLAAMDAEEAAKAAHDAPEPHHPFTD